MTGSCVSGHFPLGFGQALPLWECWHDFTSGLHVCALLFSSAHTLDFCFGSIPCLSLFSSNNFAHPFRGFYSYLCGIGSFPNIFLRLLSTKPSWSHCFHNEEIRPSDWGPLNHISVLSRDQNGHTQIRFINMRLEHPISLSLMRSQDAKPV